MDNEKSYQYIAFEKVVIFSPYGRRYVHIGALDYVKKIMNDEEDLGLILLCSLPSSYVTFRDTICIVVTR